MVGVIKAFKGKLILWTLLFRKWKQKDYGIDAKFLFFTKINLITWRCLIWKLEAFSSMIRVWEDPLEKSVSSIVSCHF